MHNALTNFIDWGSHCEGLCLTLGKVLRSFGLFFFGGGGFPIGIALNLTPHLELIYLALGSLWPSMARVRIDISSSEPMFLYHKRVEYPLQVRAEFLDELEFSESFSPVLSQSGAGD